jgi:hypothetical protein
MRHWKPIAAWGAIAALGGLIASAAVAQTPAPPQQAPNMPAPKDMPAEKVAPPLSTNSTGETLSDKLEKSEGVIKPPATGDAEIRVTPPAPNPGTTIVIPPPGTSPSDPVQPK